MTAGKRALARWMGFVCLASGIAAPASAQLTDLEQTPNAVDAGIAKTLDEEVGSGVGNQNLPGSSIFIIRRDPARSVRRGRQIFQRKFTLAQGLGPRTDDGIGDIETDVSHGAGLADSCAGCHGRPRGGAGSGGDVFTRPDSRDAPHLFGLGLQEMLGDEITADLRAQRAQALADAQAAHHNVKVALSAKGIAYGSLVARPDGSVDTSDVQGVDPDLRVRPFFAQGGTISIREFVVGAFNAEMGLEAVDPLLADAVAGQRVTTPSGMVLDGSLDAIEAPPTASPTDDPDHDGVVNELPAALIDHMEFYLLNYFKPATYRQTKEVERGLKNFRDVGCTSCHVESLTIQKDRRIADVETVYDPAHGIFNGLFATAALQIVQLPDNTGFPPVKEPALQPFVVKNFYADLKRHDLGPAFHERNFDGTITKQFMTEPLWGVGSTGPYGHDGRSMTLREVILRHGGEAQDARDRFDKLNEGKQDEVVTFLSSLILFPPDDTASNLDPGNRSAPGFPQVGHGSVRLGALFNDPTDPE